MAVDPFLRAQYDGASGLGFAATFSAIAISAAQDVFEIAAPSTKRVAISEIHLGQYSDFGDANAEILSVLIIRGYTTTGSGGASVTPVSLSGVTDAAVAGATVKRNNTTVAQDGTAATLLSNVWNVQSPYLWLGRLVIEASQRLVVRITAPADSITANGTLIFEEF